MIFRDSPANNHTVTAQDLTGLVDAFTGEALNSTLGLYQCGKCQVYYHRASYELIQTENNGKCVACLSDGITAIRILAFSSAERTAVGNQRFFIIRMLWASLLIQSEKSGSAFSAAIRRSWTNKKSLSCDTGWRWRKSTNVGGGVRINTSQSGVGYSWGVPGFRIGKSPSGNWWLSIGIPGIPGTGFSFYRTLGKLRQPRDWRADQPASEVTARPVIKERKDL